MSDSSFLLSNSMSRNRSTPTRWSSRAARVARGREARPIAAIDEAAGDPVEGYRERVTERMESTLGCIQDFLVGIGKFTSRGFARATW